MTTHDFSAQFLRIIPPDTNFGEAWESLCFDLLRADLPSASLVRFKPPDRGIDIYSPSLQRAYQCKSDERGVNGSLSANRSINSLETACVQKATLDWRTYTFCTNADYTGAAFIQINEAIRRLGLSQSDIKFLGPVYWDELCSRHNNIVKQKFDYRVTATEKQVIDAFKKSGYFDNYVKEYSEKIHNANFQLAVKNNRTSIELEFPFSPELTVKNCVDVAKEMLGISLEWTNFSDIGTSAGPSLSLTIDGKAQGFSQKIADLPINPDNDLKIWVKIVWRDETKREAKDGNKELSLYYMRHIDVRDILNTTLSRENVPYEERKRITLQRAETIIQRMIWTSARAIKSL